jgi:hypothetical protein
MGFELMKGTPEAAAARIRRPEIAGEIAAALDSVVKIIRFGTRHAELRADFFNLTNTPHWNNPSGSLESNNFGRVTSSFGERVIRFGGRLLF